MIHRRLTRKERDKLDKLITGRNDPNTHHSKEFLKRPHVAAAFETMLDESGMGDYALVNRVRAIVDRKPINNTSQTGLKSSNQTTIDANALNAVRMIWQAKGKFTEKHDITHGGNISDLSEEQLDKLISSGGEILKLKKTQIKHDDSNLRTEKNDSRSD